MEPARAVRVIDRWLASPLDHLTQISRDQTATPGDLWTFNPLYERPIVIMKDDTYVIPSPRTVLQRIAPQGLYFLARDAMDADQNPNDFRGFTAKLGLRYQTYIGEQLRLLKHARVHSEITYGSSQQSVDYIIETPEVLVLVEVKSVAPDIWTRSGVFPDGGDVDRKINRGLPADHPHRRIDPPKPPGPAQTGRSPYARTGNYPRGLLQFISVPCHGRGDTRGDTHHCGVFTTTRIRCLGLERRSRVRFLTVGGFGFGHQPDQKPISIPCPLTSIRWWKKW